MSQTALPCALHRAAHCCCFQAVTEALHALWPHQAGLDGEQKLADNFLIARATGAEAPQAVYVNRELDLDAWQLAEKVSFTAIRDECMLVLPSAWAECHQSCSSTSQCAAWAELQSSAICCPCLT